MSSTHKMYVLYVDHQGHPAPLSRCFHATASRRLASSLFRHPPSTKEEVDSAYCPQCLAFFHVATAATAGYCETCKQCPLCTSVASVHIDNNNNMAFYQCGYCKWNSKDTISMTVGDTIGKEELAQISQDLAKKTVVDESAAEQHYRKMVAAWTEVVRPTKLKTKKRSHLEPWSLEDLEASLQAKQQTKTPPVMIGDVEKVTIDDTPQEHDASLEGVPCTSLLLQTSTLVSTNGVLLPLKMPLRARKSRRCRAELAQGRPGILVKPKLNPLEGDSSLKRSGHGQWWKKDSSAIYVIPNVTVVQHSLTQGILLKVTNPTMGMVRLRLGPSKSHAGQTLTQVLLDSLENVHAKQLHVEQVEGHSTTDLVQLDAVEDAFLELGQNKEPEAVANWKATDSVGGISLVATFKDTAWFQLGLPAFEKKDWVAMPISLQIQVGQGSWESSLIQSTQSAEDGPDLVTFDLLLAWNNE